MIVTDSIPQAGDNVETLMLCSPSQLLNTSVAAETLNKVDQMDRSRESEVHMFKTMVQACLRDFLPVLHEIFLSSLWFASVLYMHASIINIYTEAKTICLDTSPLDLCNYISRAILHTPDRWQSLELRLLRFQTMKWSQEEDNLE